MIKKINNKSNSNDTYKFIINCVDKCCGIPNLFIDKDYIYELKCPFCNNIKSKNILMLMINWNLMIRKEKGIIKKNGNVCLNKWKNNKL